MEDLETEDGIERAFSKEELLEVYKRLETGDETALEPWNRYFTTLAGFSAGKCANNAYSHWHENLYNERLADGVAVAAQIGRDVLNKKTKIEGEPENYVWAAMRYEINRCDKKDKGDGSTRSKEGWQGKRWKFTEVEIPVLSYATKRLWEELMASCRNDSERNFVTLFIENGDDPKKVAQLAEMAIEEVQHLRGVVAERLAQRLREQGEPAPWLEKQAKKLKSVRKPKKSPKQSSKWKADKPQVKKVSRVKV